VCAKWGIVEKMTAQETISKGSDLPLQQKLDSLQKGDKILFNDRKEPLEVATVEEKEYTRGTAHMGIITGNRGAEYILQQSVENPDSVSIISTSLNGSREQVANLRVVN